jgi:hypothetical protein
VLRRRSKAASRHASIASFRPMPKFSKTGGENPFPKGTGFCVGLPPLLRGVASSISPVFRAKSAFARLRKSAKSRRNWKSRKGPEQICATPADAQTKTKQIEAAGLSIRTAERYEELTAPTEELTSVFDAAMENYFDEQAANKKAPTVRGLRDAIKEADRKSERTKFRNKSNSKPPAARRRPPIATSSWPLLLGHARRELPARGLRPR